MDRLYTLTEQFPSLCIILENIINCRHVTIENVMTQRPLNIAFRRALAGDKLIAWHNLVVRITKIQLSEGKDGFNWDSHNHGQFSVQSMYRFMIKPGHLFYQENYLESETPS